MGKQILLVGAVIVLIVAMAPVALADVPQLISFQGKLYDNTGNPLTGKYEITFRIYDMEEGGTAAWTETDSVSCEEGLYNIILGSTNSINLDFDGQYWLGVQVTGDDELSPRFRLVSVPTSFRAQVANQVSWTNLTDVPAGFADGTDDVGAAGGVSQIDAGTGIEVTNPNGPTATVSADIGTGENQVAAGDHNHDSDYSLIGHDHDADYVNETGPEEMSGSSDDPILTVTNNGGGLGVYGKGSFIGVYGEGFSHGVYGSSSSGIGVRGESVDSWAGYFNGNTYIEGNVGIGTDDPTSKLHVTGSSSDPLFNATNSGEGEGVFGYSNTSYGVFGQSSTDAGIHGESLGDRGVFGQYLGNGNYGYLGSSDHGVFGTHSSSGNHGWLGSSSEGVYGYSDTGDGVFGQHRSNNYGRLGSSNYGVYGQHSGSGNHGWLGSSIEGVSGWSTNDLGVSGTSSSGYGVYGSSSTGYGVYGISISGWAGYFDGKIHINGNVGIGTTDPKYNLHIHENSSSHSYLSFTNNTTGSGSNDGVLIGIDPSEDFRVHTSEANNIKFFINDSEKVRITNTGNVGIGTTDPKYNLHIHKNSSSHSYLSFTNNTTGSGSNDGVLVGIDPAEDFRIHTNEANNIKFYIDDSEKVRITNAGNVGIGNSNPTYRLQLPNNADLSGRGRANQWTTYSSREYKKDITALDSEDYANVLQKISDMDLVYYHYKNQEDDRHYLGVIAEDAPEQIVTSDGKGISLSEFTAFALAGLKAQQTEIEKLKREIEVLRKELSE